MPRNPNPILHEHEYTAWENLRGREHVKRALEVAAAGEHMIRIVCIGCPGDDRIVQAAAATIGAIGSYVLPCPCGNFGATERACICTDNQRAQHIVEQVADPAGAYSMHLQMQNESWERLSSTRSGELVIHVQARIQAARQRLHADDRPDHFARLLARCDDYGLSLFKAAKNQLAFSQSELTNTLRVARTIAALAGVDGIRAAHLAEAIQYRQRPIQVA